MKKRKDNAGLSVNDNVLLDIIGKPAEKSPLSSQDLPISDKTAKKSPGPDLAPLLAPMVAPKLQEKHSGELVIPISNLPRDRPFPDEIPDDYQFEIYRLRRQVLALNSDIRHVNDKLTKALEALHDEVRFWRLGIYEGQWETLGQAMRRMRHLEAIVKALDSSVLVATGARSPQISKG